MDAQSANNKRNYYNMDQSKTKITYINLAPYCTWRVCCEILCYKLSSPFEHRIILKMNVPISSELH